MRWFCVHPALPDNATLRVRSYPSGDAPELGRRVPKGRAVAVVSPEFEVVGAGAGAEVHRWVRVVVPDPDTGEERDGFMMASLPDGTDLLTSWHKAGFRSCCRVENSKAFLFDGPTPTADVVGLLDSVDLPYGVLEVKGTRALIQHAELEQVWIDAKELDPVCLPLRHPGCSVMHAFYMLNEALPSEAQIAIRTFPSKEADSVGLLSHGDILEVSFRSGLWLQIATAGSGEAFWIMWTTDTVELLVEVQGHGSPRCVSIVDEGIAPDPSELGAVTDVGMELQQEQMVEDDGDAVGDLAASGDAELSGVHSAEDIPDIPDASAAEVSDAAATSIETATPSPQAEESGSTGVETSTDLDHDQASPHDAMDGETTTSMQIEANWEDRPIKPARQQQFSWDERPIRSHREDENPTASVIDNRDESPSTMAQVISDSPRDSPVEHMVTPLQEPAPCVDEVPVAATAVSDTVMDEEDVSKMTVPTVDGSMALNTNQAVTAHSDERPIRPAAHAHAWDDMPIRQAVESEQGGEVSSDGPPATTAEASVDPDDRPIRPAVIVRDVDMDAVNEAPDIDADTEGDLRDGEQQPSLDFDDRLIRPAQQIDVELSTQSAENDHDRDIDITRNLLAVDNEGSGNPVELLGSVHPDDRPICPAKQQQSWDARPIQPAQLNEIDSAAHAPSRTDSEQATVDPVERPFDQVFVEDDDKMDTAGISNDEPADDLEQGEEVRVTSDPAERPITPAQQQQYAWDETTASADHATEGDGAVDRTRISSVQPDELPIRPAKTTAWDEQPILPARVNNTVELVEPGVEQSATDTSSDLMAEAQSSPAWDDRPIKPTLETFGWDERPIRPAVSDDTMDDSNLQPQGSAVVGPSEVLRSEMEQNGRQSDSVHAETVAADKVLGDVDDVDEEMETADSNTVAGNAGQGQVGTHLDDRPIRPAQTQSTWDDRPIKPAGRSHEWDEQQNQAASDDIDMEVGDSGEIGDDTAHIEADKKQLDEAGVSKTTDGDAEVRSEGVRSGLTNLHLDNEPTPHFDRASDSEPSPELEIDGYTFLSQHGIAAYFNWKKRLLASSDELSQIQYDALVEGDVDVLLETLAADVDLVDDWLQFVPVDRGADLHSDPSRVVDVLYNRNSTPPKLPRPVHNGHAAKPPMVPLSPSTTRNARLTALFRRSPRGSDTSNVFDVIMGGGSADSILEAEVADDESDFALTSQFRYPTKARRGRGGTPGRPVARHERTPIPRDGAGPALRRAVSAGSVAPSATNDSDVVLPYANEAGVGIPVPLAPAGKVNPLKRPAASMATTHAVSSSLDPRVNAEAPPPLPTEMTSMRQEQREETAKPAPASAAASTSIAAASAISSRIGKAPGSSLPASSLARPRPTPLTSRLSAPSLSSSLPQRTGSLPQPSTTSRSALPSRSMSTTATSSTTGSSSGGQSLLPRRSMLPTPTKPSALQAPAARSIAQATNASTLEARRSTFGFGRPRPSTIPKPAK